MAVLWLIQVQDAMQESLGSADPDRAGLGALLARISAVLEGTFPKADHILVLDRLGGYSSSPDRHVLRVEVIDGGISLARVVKIGPRAALSRELAGWVSCGRPSNDRGRIFMTLQPGKIAADGSGEVESLVYEDAQQTLRAAKVMTLEQAVMHCCRWGTPSAASLLGILDQVFAEVVDRLYRRSWSAVASADVCESLRKRLEPGCRKWLDRSTPQGQCREMVSAELLGSAAAYVDPVSFGLEALADPARVPEMRFGCAHGDLNGRNVLVGAIDGEARFPAVFDYEDMGAELLLGWDLAKLETELKVRAYQQLFPGDERRFIAGVYHIEEHLARETERFNNVHFQNWTDAPEHHSDEQRLFALLLGLRRQAKKCLEVIHGRHRTWLHEYYFLLACYGVYAGRYSAYYRPELVAACVSAGFAAARYAWSQTNVLLPEHLAVAEAQRALSAQDPSARLHLPTALHHGPQFAFAREFIRSRREPFVAAGIEILQDLKSLFAAALEVWQELALAHFELFDLTGNEAHLQQSERVLRQIDARCPQPHYETLCRWGRLWKDRGDRQFDEHGDCPGARSCYREALQFYQRAFDQERNYYPGINVVTLSLLLGEEEVARSLAQSLVKRVDALPRDSTAETVWRLATAAEAALVLGQGERAADLYHSAMTHSKCQPHSRESMYRQVQRILRVRPCPAVDFDEVFQVR